MSTKQRGRFTAFLLLGVLIASVSCKKGDKKIIKEVEELLTVTDYALAVNLKSSKVPKGPKAKATRPELYGLAWQQFIALNWPVADPTTPGNRGKANTSKSFLNITAANTPTVVWSTYASKAEVFGPEYQTTLPAWNTLALPKYSYHNSVTAKSIGDSFSLFNNLDENNEIGEATVWAGVKKGDTIGGSQVLYEAKMNETEYTYIRNHNLQNVNTVKTWVGKTKNDLNTYGGTCETTAAATQQNICFPCADEASEGVIEIKAAWRELESGIDTPERFYTKDVIIYEKNSQGKTVYTNKTYALIGLHIIRKTENYPTFIFTTFGHVDNIKNGIYYNNEIALGHATPPYYQYYDKNGNIDTTSYPNHKYIKTGNISVESQDEIHPIAPDLKVFNSEIQKRINTANSESVWQYYELLGLQAVPVDYKNRGADVDYYLANNVIETDYTLREFTGAFGNPTGIQLEVTNVNTKGETVSMGGCMGCHGNAQKKGGDFSFLINGGDNLTPETIEPPINSTSLESVKAYAKDL